MIVLKENYDYDPYEIAQAIKGGQGKISKAVSDYTGVKDVDLWLLSDVITTLIWDKADKLGINISRFGDAVDNMVEQDCTFADIDEFIEYTR